MAGSKGSKYYDVFLNYKIWLSVKKDAIVDEKLLQLLSAISHSGSLSYAAKTMNISYRKAWSDLKNAENALGIEFVKKERGGKNGGHSYLTDEGLNILNAYNELKAEFDISISNITKKFFKQINAGFS